MKSDMNFGKRIAQIRHSRGMTQAELGKLVNVEWATISMYERGERTPSMETIMSLSRALHVSADYLMKGKEAQVLNCSELDEREYLVLSELVSVMSEKNDKTRKN